ncbi:MAG: pirin family protein [Gammaproteobacteria bacterium]
MKTRTLKRLIPSIETSDGAGVKLRRSLGASAALRVDPFLMLDEFGTHNPDDYIAGFPPHPHRGFETVTYMLDGHMRHEDHMGNVGELTEGGVQWMTAGRGVIHSEMPQQKEGRMRGFQLWVNLPAAEKMVPAQYRDIPAGQIPVDQSTDAAIKVIAGTIDASSTTTTRLSDNSGSDGTRETLSVGDTISGPIQGLTTEPVFLDVVLPPETVFTQKLPETHSAFVYAYEGELELLQDTETRENGAVRIPAQQAAVLSDGQELRVASAETETRFILLAGKPLNEPVVQRGPFVMNTQAEISQAIHDYSNGVLTD